MHSVATSLAGSFSSGCFHSLDPKLFQNGNVTRARKTIGPARILLPSYVITSYSIHYTKLYEGLNTEEIMEIRLRGGLPRGNALRHVQDKHDVNMMACICALDRATLIPVADFWAPGVQITGVHEMVGNALNLKGQKKREVNLRGEELEEVRNNFV